jgi:hypothetical protein
MMGNSAARNVLLLILAMAVGLALGAVAKFGLGQNISLGIDNSALKASPVRSSLAGP